MKLEVWSLDIMACLEMEIKQCQKRYDADKEHPFLSNIYGAELEQLKEFNEKLHGGESLKGLLTSLKHLLPELKEYREQEAVDPSFDWYGEHYKYEQLEGVCSAFETMIRLLDQAI